MRGQSVRSSQLRVDLPQALEGWCRAGGLAGQRGQRLVGDAVVGGDVSPVDRQCVDVDVGVFGGAGVEGGDLRGAGGVPAELVEPFEDLMPSLRQVVDEGTGDTGQVRDPVPNLTPLQAE